MGLTRIAARPASFAALASSLLLLLLACDKSPATTSGPTPSATGSTASAPDASTSAGSATAKDPAAEAKPVHLAGTYKTARGTMYVPEGPEYAGTKWRGDESAEGLGEGPMELTIDPRTGRVDGRLEGPLGATVVYGSFREDALSATIVRKDVGDRGFSGTLFGKGSMSALEGTMKLSLPDAHVIREGHFTLKRKD
ncbi:hypothetical protein [Pendulispora albinea]|uniref:Lipoprotein n=1 Tax=Pendulispora albinea TaxID=2741071 RepID=A0ABZ2LUS2_9BACT